MVLSYLSVFSSRIIKRGNQNICGRIHMAPLVRVNTPYVKTNATMSRWSATGASYLPLLFRKVPSAVLPYLTSRANDMLDRSSSSCHPAPLLEYRIGFETSNPYNACKTSVKWDTIFRRSYDRLPTDTIMSNPSSTPRRHENVHYGFP